MHNWNWQIENETYLKKTIKRCREKKNNSAHIQAVKGTSYYSAKNSETARDNWDK